MSSQKPFVIEPLRASDAESIFDLMSRNAPRFQRFFSRTLFQNKTLRDSKAYILLKNSEAQLKKELTWGIRATVDNEVQGLIVLRQIDWESKQGELAYCIDKAYEGKGWTTQVVTEITHFIGQTLEIKTLQLIIHKENIGSIRVAEKSGYQRIQTLPKHYTPPGESALDMELYEIAL